MNIDLKHYSIIDRIFHLIERDKPSDRLVMRILFFLIVVTGIYFILALNQHHSILQPTKGGGLVEGMIGTPHFINPALAISRADQDTVALIYAGLLKIDENGDLKPDLAESITVEDEGATYHIKIKQGLTFHDDTSLTASDVTFTINLIKDPLLKSPLRGVWNDVTVEEVNSFELKVKLKEAYSPFIENFTLGIMPKHIWENLPIEQLPFSLHNVKPIGSGLFQIDTVNNDKSGLINGYILKPAKNVKSNLTKVELKYYTDEDQLLAAFNKKEVNSTAFLSPAKIATLNPNTTEVISRTQPRVFAVFFNQNRSAALRDLAARQALNTIVDRPDIINRVLNGFGIPITTPILENESTLELAETEETNRLEEARQILLAGGWKQTEQGTWTKEISGQTETLSLTIKTSNTELFDQTVHILANSWRELGVEVQVEEYEQSNLVQSVIRTRDFQALLFGLDLNRIQDLYPFWHSSQKDDPGLNISQYTNVSVDKLLEDTRKTEWGEARQQQLTDISQLITAETPAIFLFAPKINYVINDNLKIAPVKYFNKPSDRFMNITTWYAKSETVWTVFKRD